MIIRSICFEPTGPQAGSQERGSARVSRARSGVAPELWPPAIPGISGAKKFAGRGFRRDAEKHTPEAVCSPERPNASVFDFGIRIEDLEGWQPARQLSEVGGGSHRTPQIKAGQPPLSSLRSALFRMNRLASNSSHRALCARRIALCMAKT